MRKSLLIASGLLVIILIFTVLFGKLFPYSPLITGFTRHESAGSVVFIQHGTIFNDLLGIDSLSSAVEKSHDLKFGRKPSFFIFRDSITYVRHSPSRARFCAFLGKVFISPWAIRESEEGIISLETYLKHELSHVLLYRNIGLLSYISYPKWLDEGIAVYTSGQAGTSFYPGKEEIYRSIRKGNFMPPGYFKTKREDRIVLDVRYRQTFMYSEFACIVDYLVNRYGRDLFRSYMKSLVFYRNDDRVFEKIYGLKFDRFLQEFRQYAIENAQD
jgi:hypothetical protein